MNEKKQHTPLSVRTFTLFDLLIIIIAFNGVVFSIPVILAHQPSTVAIYKDNTIIAEYPLSENKEVHIEGHEGPMTVILESEHVLIKNSTCRKQICVKSGRIGRAFQQLVCAPNHVLIEIRSNKKEEEKIDAIVQ